MKRFKFNFLVFVLLLLTATALVYKAGIFDNTSSIAQIEIPNDDQDEGSGSPSDPVDPGPEEIEIPIEKDKKIPSSRYPTKLLNYCINKLGNSKGYQMNFSLMTTMTTKVVGISAYGEQIVSGNITKSDNSRYEFVRLEALNEVTKMVTPRDGYQIIYADGENYHYWETPRGVFDLSKAVYESWSPENNPLGRRFYYDFLYEGVPNTPAYSGKIEFENNSSSISVKTQKDKTGKNNYIITVKLIDKKSYPSSFLRPYNSLLSQFDMKSLEETIIFTIDQESGWIKSMNKTDVYFGYHHKYPGIGITSSLTYKATYSNHNQITPITTLPIPTK